MIHLQTRPVDSRVLLFPSGRPYQKNVTGTNAGADAPHLQPNATFTVVAREIVDNFRFVESLYWCGTLHFPCQTLTHQKKTESVCARARVHACVRVCVCVCVRVCLFVCIVNVACKLLLAV